MKIYIVSVGNIKEKYLIDAINEYTKRLSKYTKVEFLKVSDEAINDHPSDKEIDIIKNKEGEKILKILPSNSYKVALDLKGEMLSSEGLASKMLDIFSYHNANISFIIGFLSAFSSILITGLFLIFFALSPNNNVFLVSLKLYSFCVQVKIKVV